MPVIIDGTAGITFPVTAGSASAVQASSGRVLQVINATSSTEYSTSSSTFVATGFTASITPSSSSSKVLLTARVPVRSNNSQSPYGSVSWYRGGSALITTNTYEGGATTSSGNQQDIRLVVPQFILDSPATTSSVTYSLYFVCNSGAGSMYVNPNSAFTTSIILMEISA